MDGRGIGEAFDFMFKAGCGIIIALALAVIGLVAYICVR